jgi:AraC-like DNA-binding protein
LSKAALIGQAREFLPKLRQENHRMRRPAPKQIPMLLPAAGYQEHSYNHDQGGCIEAVWTCIARKNGEHRVLPDGRSDLILRFEFDDAGAIGNVEPLIAGPSRTYQMVPLSHGIGFAGVRLRPGTAGPVLGVRMASIAEQVFAADDAIRVIPALSGLRGSARSVEALVARLVKFIGSRCRADGSGGNAGPSMAIIRAFHLTRGRVSVAELAKMHQVDERTVRRRVKESTGLTPKALSMILQFHRALRLVRDVSLDPVDAAAEAGYADQAHMTRMFRALGGFTPANIPDVTLAGLPL